MSRTLTEIAFASRAAKLPPSYIHALKFRVHKRERRKLKSIQTLNVVNRYRSSQNGCGHVTAVILSVILMLEFDKMETRIEDFGYVNRGISGSPEIVATIRFHASVTASFAVIVTSDLLFLLLAKPWGEIRSSPKHTSLKVTFSSADQFDSIDF